MSAAAASADSVVGTGVSGFCGARAPFSVDAQSGPSGENPGGTLVCGTLLVGPVTCLNVQGNVALLEVATAELGSVAVRITDGGATGGDRVEVIPGRNGCSGPLIYVDVAFAGGDIVVTDTQPFPTSKQQCKKGGYQQFGFTNQGRCIASVKREKVASR